MLCNKTTGSPWAWISIIDPKMKNIESILSNSMLITKNNRSKVDGKVFVSAIPDQMQYIDQKVYGSGILMLVAWWNDGIAISMLYLYRQWNIIGVRQWSDMFRYQITDNKWWLYAYKNIKQNQYIQWDNATLVIKSTWSTQSLDNKSRQYIIDVFRGKIKSTIFNDALKEIVQ